MIRRLTFAVLLEAGLLAGVPGPVALRAQEPGLPRIAIMDFDASPGGWTLPPPHLGETAAQLVLDRLVGAGQFHVLDGQWLRRGVAAGGREAAPDALLANARRADVDYLVLGSITEFSMENRQRTAGGLLAHVPLAGFSRGKARLAVSILVRVVDVRNGEIVTTASGTGAGVRGNVSIGAMLMQPFGLGGFRSGASGSRDGQLNEALTHAVDAVARALANASPRLVAGREAAFSDHGPQ